MTQQKKRPEDFPDVSRVDYTRMFRLGTRMIDKSGMPWRYVKISSSNKIHYYRWLPDKFIIYVCVADTTTPNARITIGTSRVELTQLEVE